MPELTEYELAKAAHGLRRRGLGWIAIGLFGVMSFKPIWDHDWDTRRWDWLAWVGLAIWVAFLGAGIFSISKSFRLKVRPEQPSNTDDKN